MATTELHISFASHPKDYVAVAIHDDYIDDSVVVGMTVTKGLEHLRERIRQMEDDGA